MEDITVRKLFTLLSACVNDDVPMTQIVLEKMSQSEEYQLLSSLDQFDFLTDQGRNLEKRMRDFDIFQPDNLLHTYKLLNNLTSLASEFKNVLNESRIAAEEPIFRPYREAHILEKNYLQLRLDKDKRALVESEAYRLWQDRGNYFYDNYAASQLKVEMDSFKCGIETRAEVRQSYVVMQSFQNRFQQNRSEIISFQEAEQRENARIEEAEQRENARIEEDNRLRKEWIRKNYPNWLFGLDLIVVIGVIIFASVEKGVSGFFMAIFADVVGGFAMYGLAYVMWALSAILSLIIGHIEDDKYFNLLTWVAFIFVILWQYMVLGSVFE